MPAPERWCPGELGEVATVRPHRVPGGAGVGQIGKEVTDVPDERYVCPSWSTTGSIAVIPSPPARLPDNRDDEPGAPSVLYPARTVLPLLILPDNRGYPGSLAGLGVVRAAGRAGQASPGRCADAEASRGSTKPHVSRAGDFRH
jgi:hypothetical protein